MRKDTQKIMKYLLKIILKFLVIFLGSTISILPRVVARRLNQFLLTYFI